MKTDARPPDTGQKKYTAPNAELPDDPFRENTREDVAGILSDTGLREEPQEEEVRRKSRLRYLLPTMLVFVAIIFFLRYQVFTVSHVRVTGNRNISWQAVAQAAGLDRGLFYFTLNEDEIRNGINANRYLIYQGMEKIFPNTLALTVKERQPVAFFTHLGIGFIIATDGMILEKTKDLYAGYGLITVSGLSVWGQLNAGMIPATTDSNQIEKLVILLDELENWGFNTQVSIIDIAQSLNISLITGDNYTIHLGSPDNLHAKIGTVQSVVLELRRRQMMGGIIEATVPGEASYRPMQR